MGIAKTLGFTIVKYMYSLMLKQLLNKNTNPKLGLTRMMALLQAIGFRRDAFKIIQVVGTNGKGSTCAFLESMLYENNIACGMFTSPHLCSAKERIRINKNNISETDFVKAAQFVLTKAAALDDEPSFFECILAMAMWIFQEKKIEVLILEAGLGGRLDATTATKPDILGISLIDLDHQNILGHSVYEIAIEKSFAARANQVVVISPQSSEAMQGVEQAQKIIGFKPVLSSISKEKLGLVGDYQSANAGLAVQLLVKLGLNTCKNLNSRGLLLARWPGRLEVINTNPKIILDGAHNVSGIQSLVRNLSPEAGPFVLIYGSMRGENCFAKISSLLNSKLKIAHIFLYEPKNPRAASLSELREIFIKNGFLPKNLSYFEDINNITKQAQIDQATMLICGSLYVVGELRAKFLNIKLDDECPNF